MISAMVSYRRPAGAASGDPSARSRSQVRKRPACYLFPMIPECSRAAGSALARRRGSAGSRALAGGLAATALILVAACSGGAKSAGGGASAAAVSPRQALLTAAIQAQRINSAVQTLNIRTVGADSSVTTGTIEARLKPNLLISEDLHATAAGKSTEIKAVVTGKAVYLSEPPLTSQPGKPWIKLNLSSLKGTSGASFVQLLHGIQNNTFTNQAQLVTVAKNARVVGQQTVDGVPTTEYAGSFKAPDALKVLPASLRSILAPALKLLGDSTITFHEWIDGQHHTRKLTEVETINGNTVYTTINITSINQPVSITPPPASQTVTVPGSSLGSATTS